MTAELAHTPLFERHQALGARIAPFAGFAMPIGYPAGTLAEYEAARGEDGAALFDVSHMGQIWIEGDRALDLVQRATTNDAARLMPGQVQYSALLRDDGGFLDDLTVHRFADGRFLLCVNAANRARDRAQLAAIAAGIDRVQVIDRSAETALLALQGPAAERMLAPFVEAALDRVGYYRFIEARAFGAPAIVARTGYTGEDGFEIYLPADVAGDAWDRLCAAGAQPAGLACRDLLRTEMGYPLYGHEIDETVTPVEAGLMWIVALDKGEFVGRDAVRARLAEGPRRRLIGLRADARGAPPRPGYPVLAEDGRRIGEVTSGAFSPRLGLGVALAYVAPEHADDVRMRIEVRGRALAMTRVRPPFVSPRVRRGR